MADDSLDKTESPTPKKREDAKKKGQVARSMDVIHATTLGGFLIGVTLFGEKLYSDLFNLFETYLRIPVGEISKEGSADILSGILLRATVISGPIACLLSVTLVAANTAQTGLSFNPERLALNWNRVNPLQGVKKLLSWRGIANVGSSFFKIAVILWAVISTVSGHVADVAVLGESSLAEGVKAGMDLVFMTVFRVTLALLVIAILDYAYQRWQITKDLMMSKEEIKEETKSTEGDPRVKGRIRKMQRSLASSRMVDDAADADVIVTNPHRLAIALRYRRGEDRAPVVVAKGMNLIAKRIRAVARKNGVPLVENKPLAWALYRTVEIGSTIPEKLYQAVAEVLSFVYRFKEKR